MAHADMNLPPELLEGYEQTVELRDRNGNIRADARETVIQIVKPMLTLGGKLEESVARRLGGQPSGHHAGRAKLVQPLIDAVRGLVGPLPNLKAWLMAEASGGFDCRSNTGYRSRLKKGSSDERGIGSPGAYLPRQLAQQRDDIAKGRVSHTTSWVQHTEISVMTAALLLQDIQRAAGATLAMGPAFVIMTAVDTLPEAVQRKIDALAGDDEYRARIAKAIDEVTAKFEADSQRSNQQIKTSLPSGVDIEAYFEEREATFRKAALDEVMSAIDQMLKPKAGQEVQSDIQRAASLIIAKVRSAAPNGGCPDTERRIIYATSYMDRAVKRGGAIAPDDVKRLQVLLPHLWQDETDETQYAAALLSANIFSADSDIGTFWFTGEQGTDSVIRGIMKRIARYVMEVGPPPFDVPPEHLPLFGLVASTCVALGATEYQGIKTWQQLGALKGNEIDPAAIDPKILAVRTIGLAGLTV